MSQHNVQISLKQLWKVPKATELLTHHWLLTASINRYTKKKLYKKPNSMHWRVEIRRVGHSTIKIAKHLKLHLTGNARLEVLGLCRISWLCFPQRSTEDQVTIKCGKQGGVSINTQAHRQLFLPQLLTATAFFVESNPVQSSLGRTRDLSVQAWAQV